MIKEITLLEIKKLEKLLKSARISLAVSDTALARLAELGYNPVLGARPLKRVIQREIQDQLSTLILEGAVASNSLVKIDYRGNEWKFESSSAN